MIKWGALRRNWGHGGGHKRLPLNKAYKTEVVERSMGKRGVIALMILGIFMISIAILPAAKAQCPAGTWSSLSQLTGQTECVPIMGAAPSAGAAGAQETTGFLLNKDLVSDLDHDGSFDSPKDAFEGISNKGSNVMIDKKKLTVSKDMYIFFYGSEDSLTLANMGTEDGKFSYGGNTYDLRPGSKAILRGGNLVSIETKSWADYFRYLWGLWYNKSLKFTTAYDIVKKSNVNLDAQRELLAQLKSSQTGGRVAQPQEPPLPPPAAPAETDESCLARDMILSGNACVPRTTQYVR